MHYNCGRNFWQYNCKKTPFLEVKFRLAENTAGNSDCSTAFDRSFESLREFLHCSTGSAKTCCGVYSASGAILNCNK